MGQHRVKKHLLLGLLIAATLVAVVALLMVGWFEGAVLAGTLLGFLVTRLLLEIRWRDKTPPQLLQLLIPGAAAAIQAENERRENRHLASTMAKVLEVHGFAAKPKQVMRGCAGGLPTHLVHAERVAACASWTARRLAETDGLQVPVYALELLLFEWEGAVPAHRWPPTAAERGQLAGVLLEHSRRLARWRERLDLKTDDVDRVLARLPRFRLSEVEERLRRCDDVSALEKAFLAFLAENDLATDDDRVEVAATLARMERIERREDPLLEISTVRNLDFADQMRLLSVLGVGETTLRAACGPLPDDEIERRALLSLILFSTRLFAGRTIRPAACHLLAMNPRQSPAERTGVRMAWSYLDVQRDFHNGIWECAKPFVCLRQFFDEWPERLTARAGDSELDKELEPLYFALLQGEWVASKNELMGRVFAQQLYAITAEEPEPDPSEPTRGESARRQILPPPGRTPEDLLGRFPGIDDSLRKLAADLDLATVERYIETRNVSPYLITLGPSAGPFPRLLDCLANPGKRELLVEVGLEMLTEEGVPKYNFRQYTPYTRVGLVPKGVSFSRFARTFRDDVRRLIAEQRRILPITAKDPVGEFYEVLLHAFNPAASNPLGFGQPKGGDGAMQRIKELFAEQLDARDLLSLLIYAGLPGQPTGGRLLEALVATPVAEPTRAWRDLSARAREELEEADALIKAETLTALQEAGHDPAKALAPASDLRTEVLELLAAAMRRRVQELDEKPVLARKIARSYLETLHRRAVDEPVEVLRKVRLDSPTRTWDDLTRAERDALEQADQKVKRDFLQRLGIDLFGDERPLIRRLEGQDPRWEETVAALAEAVARHVAPLADRPDMVRRVAEAYLQTLRAAARDLVGLELTLGRLVLASGREAAGSKN